VPFDQEEPVSSPSHIPGDLLTFWNLDRHILGLPIARHVIDRDGAIAVQRGRDHSDRSLDAMLAGADAPQVRERGHQADGAVTAHAEVAGVVEEQHAGDAGRIARLDEHRADDDIRAARLVHHRRAEAIMFRAKQLQALREIAAAEIRASIEDDSRGLTAGVGIDDAYLLHEVYFTI
jgi:hypothetical protein